MSDPQDEEILGKNIMLRIVCCTLLIMISLLAIQDSANAGFSVSPVVLEVVVNKGEVTKGIFRVTNTGERPVDVVVRPERWSKGKESIDYHEWLKLDPVRFTLNSRRSKKVNYEITVPEGATGEMLCMVYFIAVEKGKGASPIGIRFGVPIYAVVEGPGELDVKIESIDIDYDKDNHVIKGQFMVNNQSKVHIRPDVEISMLDEEGNLAARFMLPFKQPAQREQKRPFFIQKDLVIKPGKYKVIIRADCGKLYGIDKVIQGEGDLIIEEEEEKLDVTSESESSSIEDNQAVVPEAVSPETK